MEKPSGEKAGQAQESGGMDPCVKECEKKLGQLTVANIDEFRNCVLECRGLKQQSFNFKRMIVDPVTGEVMVE